MLLASPQICELKQMIPGEFRTPRLEAAFAALTSVPDLGATRDVSNRDILIIGRYVQKFNLIELNRRRSLEMFSRGG